MDSAIQNYLRDIGRRGGKKSRRKLSPESARDMVRIREARRAYRTFHARCFWSFDPDYVVSLEDIPWIVRYLRAHGARPGWEKAATLCL